MCREFGIADLASHCTSSLAAEEAGKKKKSANLSKTNGTHI
jgi:hypothetical protein